MPLKTNHHFLSPENCVSGTRHFRLALILLLSGFFIHFLAPNLLAQKWNGAEGTPASSPGDKAVQPATRSKTPDPSSSAPRPRAKSNRFLLAVDTSAPMKSHMAAMGESIDQILLSRASGQLYRGDTLGLWTFDTELHTGNFPLEVWTPEDEKAVTTRVSDFLKKQRFGKQSRFDALLPAVHELVKQSDIITIIILSDGQNQMQGTPFDREINNSYQQTLREMGADQMPIVTVLQAKGGKYVKYNVTALPWPVIIPELPIPLKEEQSAASSAPVTPTAHTNAAKATPVNQPLIVTGSKPAQPSPPAVPVPQPEVKPEAQVTSQTPTPAPITQAPAPVAKVEAPSDGQPVTPPSTPPTPVPVRNHPAPAAVASETTVPPKAEVPTQSTTPVVIPKPSAPLVANAPESKPKATPGNGSTALKRSGQKLEPATVQPEPADAPATPVAIATASPAQARPKALLIAAITLVAVALGLVVLMLRRATTASGPSLITRSLNRKK